MSQIYRKLLSTVGVVTLLVTSRTIAAPPPEARVQGLYEGVVKGADNSRVEARVVAQGGGTYKVLIRQMLKDQRIAHVELVARTTGDAVTITEDRAGGWNARYADGSFEGTCGPGNTAWEVRRVEKKPPTLGKKPPQGAVALLEGKDLPEMVRADGAQWHLGDMSQQGCPIWEVPLYIYSEKEPTTWPGPDQLLPQGWALGKEHRRAGVVTGIAEDGSLQVPRGGMNSTRAFEGSFDLHVEFFLPLMPTAHGQGRSNSGVYLPCGQEIQVLDSFGEVTYKGGGCGGMYAFKDPDAMDVIESLKDKPECNYSLAALPPLEWQTFDVEYRVDRRDGKYAGRPHVTVYHNGVKIHDNFTLPHNTRKGKIHLQDHGSAVRYRNLWVLPIDQ